MKAIETQYKGYRFRSRLEARYAVFFDALGVEWEYEKEGYELGRLGRYLPDFFLPFKRSKFPGAGYWLEVKGEFPTPEEIIKMRALCMLTRHHGEIYYGLPGRNRAISFSNTGDMCYDGFSDDGPHELTKFTKVVEHGASDKDAFMCLFHTSVMAPVLDWGMTVEKLEYAIVAAKSARFEFGQSGAAK